jgi:hypothetical protein
MPLKCSGWLAALHHRQRAVGERVVAGLRGELQRAQAEPVHRAEHREVAFVVDAGLAAEEHRDAPARHDRARVRDGERDRHLVGMPLGEAVRGLDQRSACFGE